MSQDFEIVKNVLEDGTEEVHVVMKAASKKAPKDDEKEDKKGNK